jgi:flavin-binding protein dodecin
MAVRKAVDLTGSGRTIEDAVAEAVDRAGLTLEAITAFDIVQVSGVVDGAQISYEVQLKVWFTLLERMHG